jgi:hypothetical protein
MGWMIGVLVFDSQQGVVIFLFATVSRMGMGPTQPPIQWVPGLLSLGVKQLKHEADHSPHLVLRSGMHGPIFPFPQYIFMVWCLVRHKENFTFTRGCIHLDRIRNSDVRGDVHMLSIKDKIHSH